jgi:hypothetical protein
MRVTEKKGRVIVNMSPDEAKRIADRDPQIISDLKMHIVSSIRFVKTPDYAIKSSNRRGYY